MDCVSLNVRGLNDIQKRRTIFQWLQYNKYSIICIQETFLIDSKVKEFNNDWDGKSFHTTSNSSHSRGVSILFNKDFDFELINIVKSNDGRALLLNISYNSQTYTVVNLYAPNNEAGRKSFFNNMKKWILEHSMNTSSIIVCGDLNCSLTALDRLHESVDRSRICLSNMISNLDLKDVFRQLNKNIPGYTYSNKSGSVKSRTDYILASPYVLNRVKKVYLLTPPKCPDHKAVILKLNSECQLGNGYWKLNINHLKDDDFITLIRNTIDDVKQQMAGLNSRLLWDYCKLRIKEVSIEYASKMAQQRKSEISICEKRLEELDKLLETKLTHGDHLNLNTERNEIRSILDVYYKNESIGNAIRARMKHIEFCDKNTKFFLNLEKKRQTNNIISSIYNCKGIIVNKSEEILEEGANYYRNLYKSKNIEGSKIDEYLAGVMDNKCLDPLEASLCEGIITDAKCENIITTLSKNTSPGLDGLNSEFYMVFWKDIKDLVINSYNEAFTEGKLSISHRQILITLLFKKEDRKKFKNYRPISLSNVDYKILAFVLSKRLQKVMAKLISMEQVSYINNRYIGQNIRLLLDTIDYVNNNNKTGALLFLDFQKAFDSLEWNFIHKCLIKMGFGNDFCKWVKIIYNEPCGFIKINGFISSTINIQRGIRQGCPLSALLFIICTEYMSLHIKQNKGIEGISLSDESSHDIKITQYADDTCLFLKDDSFIEDSLQEIQNFGSVSGLSLNLNKTEGLLIGTLKHKLPRYNAIKWPKEPIRYLGIYIQNDMTKCYKQNWDDKIENMQKLIDCWRTRKLTLKGKIIILKTLVLPKIIYSVSLLPLPENLITRLNKMFYRFIWGVKDKIKRRILINSFSNGGLNMIDIESHFAALKAAWGPRLYNNNDIWSIIPNKYLTKYLSHLYSKMSFCNSIEMPVIKKLPKFYQEVVIGICTANIMHVPQTKNELYDNIIWGNSLFRFKNECLFDKCFIDSGYIYIKDILNIDGTFKEDIFTILSNKQSYFRTIYSLKSCLKAYNEIRFSNVFGVQYENNTKDKSNKKCKDFYKVLISKKIINNKCCNRWSTLFDEDITNEFFYINKMKHIFDGKVEEFNYKLYNNLLPTMDNLFKWGKTDSPNCIYCTNVIQNSYHLLITCPHLNNIWNIIRHLFDRNINSQEIIIGIDNDMILNNILSQINFIIYKKYLIDKDNPNDIPILHFIKFELVYYEKVYSSSDNLLYHQYSNEIKRIIPML